MNNVWLIGLGGIGQAIRMRLEAQSINVRCFSSSGSHPFDITSEDEINALIKSTDVLPDTIIMTPGMLHNNQYAPEKSIATLDTDWLKYSMAINVLPTLLFAKALSQRLNRSSALVFASFSARVSSISDNHLGGWHSYRMSKAMLNMLIKNIAIEWQMKSPQSIIFGYHPGTVDTTMSKPFQQRVKKEQLFSPTQAANYFLDCLRSRSIEHSGRLFDWQQKEIMP